MKIEISDTDHARLARLAEERGETDISRLVSIALDTYVEAQERQQEPDNPQEPMKEGRWAKVARLHRENPSLTGKSEQVNDLIHEFRREFSV